MLKRSLGLLALTMMMSGQAAMGGQGLFGINFLSDSCSDSCAQDACGEPTEDVCGDSCADACGELGCGDGCASLFGDCGAGLLGLIKKSDHCFDDFISPMTNPVFFEDPRTLTEARAIFANHSVPNSLGGGNAQLYAMQLRAALSEDLSIIATKDGFLVSDNPLIADGWMDVSAGLKLNVYKDYQSQTLASVGATYEIPMGSTRTLQGNGEGEFHFFGSGATEFLDDFHYITGTGLRLPVDQNAESTMIYWSNHVDRKLGKSGFYLLGETNWYHWTDDGNVFPAPVEGLDIFNFGSTGVDENDIVTGAIGVKYKPSGNMEIGLAWEAPLTSRRDILDDRITFDWIFRY